MRLVTIAAATLSLLVSFPAAAAKAPARAKAAQAAPAEVAPAPASTGTAYAADVGFDPNNLSISGWVGGEFGDISGFALRGEGSLPIMALSPSVDLLGVGQLGFTHFAKDVPFGSFTWNVVKVTATARFQMPFTPELSGFADGGLGFYYGGWKEEFKDPFFGTTYTFSGSTGGMQMRFAIGGFYQIQPKLQLGVDLGANPYFGKVDTTDFFVDVGLQYKL